MPLSSSIPAAPEASGAGFVASCDEPAADGAVDERFGEG
jgi:hypothetical protein